MALNVMAATLVYNTPDLADAMRAQLPDVAIVDNGSCPPIDGARIRLPDPRGFAGGWNDAMMALGHLGADYVWMLNSDVEGVTPTMLGELADVAEHYGYSVVTPAFNSPHAAFHRFAGGIRAVSWIDWCCPLVSMDAWCDLNGFDEQFNGYFADVDWCKRGRELQMKYAVCDWLDVHHIGSVTAQRMGHVWDADDSRLRAKWGKGWTELV